jgi:hypothetical protein
MMKDVLKTVVACSGYDPGICLEGLRKKTKISLECYCYNNLLGLTPCSLIVTNVSGGPTAPTIYPEDRSNRFLLYLLDNMASHHGTLICICLIPWDPACVCIRYRGNVSTEPLASNDRGVFTEPLPSNNREIFTEPLPSNDRWRYTDTHTHTATLIKFKY